MHEEYQAIVDAGLILQVDDPWLTTLYHDDPWNIGPEGHIEVLNHALRGIPPEAVRYHTCYGINEGPRVHDVPLGTHALHVGFGDHGHPRLGSFGVLDERLGTELLAAVTGPAARLAPGAARADGQDRARNAAPPRLAHESHDLLAGMVSSKPLLFILGTWLVLAWRVEGWRGLARWLLPLLGTPRWPGRLRHGRPDAEEGHARAATRRAA